jgi:hypothetical protein
MFVLTLRSLSNSDISAIQAITPFSKNNELKNEELNLQFISKNAPQYVYLHYINYLQSISRPHNRLNFSADHFRLYMTAISPPWWWRQRLQPKGPFQPTRSNNSDFFLPSLLFEYICSIYLSGSMTAVAVFRKPNAIPPCFSIDFVLYFSLSWLRVLLPSMFF